MKGCVVGLPSCWRVECSAGRWHGPAPLALARPETSLTKPRPASGHRLKQGEIVNVAPTRRTALPLYFNCCVFAGTMGFAQQLHQQPQGVAQFYCLFTGVGAGRPTLPACTHLPSPATRPPSRVPPRRRTGPVAWRSRSPRFGPGGGEQTTERVQGSHRTTQDRVCPTSQPTASSTKPCARPPGTEVTARARLAAPAWAPRVT